MRICVVANSFPGTSETFILNHVIGLLKRGVDVDVVGAAPVSCVPHRAIEESSVLDHVHYVTPIRPAQVLKVALMTLRTAVSMPKLTWRAMTGRRQVQALHSLLLYGRSPLVEQSYDLIHCHYGPNGAKVAALRRLGLCAGRLVVTFHGYDANKLPREYGPDLYRKRGLFEQADVCTVSTDFMRDRVVALGGDPRRIVKIPWGVNLGEFALADRQAAAGRALRVLSVCNLVEFKGVEYALRGVALARQGGLQLEYRIVGDGILRDSLERLSRDLGIRDCVSFLGAQPQERVLAEYHWADMFLLAGVEASDGKVEAQGVVLAEAAATGLPILASKVGAIPETVLDGVTGFLVPQRDVEALAQKLRSLAERPEQRAAMGQAGRAHVEAHFDCEKLNDQMLDLYKSLL